LAFPKRPNDTIRIGRGQLEILRHLKKIIKMESRDMVKYLLSEGIVAGRQRAEESVNLLIKATVIKLEGNVLRLTTSGRTFLEVLEIMLSK